MEGMRTLQDSQARRATTSSFFFSLSMRRFSCSVRVLRRSSPSETSATCPSAWACWLRSAASAPASATSAASS